MGKFRQKPHLYGFPKLIGSRKRGQRHVYNVIRDTGFRFCSRSGIKRILVRRPIKQMGIVLEHFLGAITMMHIEIHNRDSLQAVSAPCVGGANSDIIEQTKSH